MKPNNNHYMSNHSNEERVQEESKVVHTRIEMGKKDDKAIRVLLVDRNKYKEKVDDLIKSNTKRYVSKNSKFTISTKKATHVTQEVCPGVKLS